MKDDGDTKDDVKVPDNELGERIIKMFRDEEKDVSKYNLESDDQSIENIGSNQSLQTSSSRLPWVRRSLLRPRRPPNKCHDIGFLTCYVNLLCFKMGFTPPKKFIFNGSMKDLVASSASCPTSSLGCRLDR